MLIKKSNQKYDNSLNKNWYISNNKKNTNWNKIILILFIKDILKIIVKKIFIIKFLLITWKWIIK